MRRRTPAATAGQLPPDLADGPWSPSWGRDDQASRIAWQVAGRAWSQEHVGNPNGWERLLPAETRLRLRFDRYDRLVALAPGSPLYPMYVQHRKTFATAAPPARARR